MWTGGIPPCYCESDFNDAANWDNGAPGSNVAKLEHSNASVTDEDYVDMAFSTVCVSQLKVITEHTGGADTLDIRFIDATAVLSVKNELKVDATDGAVSLIVHSGGQLVNVGGVCPWTLDRVVGSRRNRRQAPSRPR